MCLEHLHGPSGNQEKTDSYVQIIIRIFVWFWNAYYSRKEWNIMSMKAGENRQYRTMCDIWTD